MKKLLYILLLLILSAHTEILAQGCSTCTATANSLDKDSAKGLNSGILYLAFTPLIFMGVTAYVWYKRTHPNNK